MLQRRFEAFVSLWEYLVWCRLVHCFAQLLPSVTLRSIFTFYNEANATIHRLLGVAYGASTPKVSQEHSGSHVPAPRLLCIHAISNQVNVNIDFQALPMERQFRIASKIFSFMT